jgi:hypothetical protein
MIKKNNQNHHVILRLYTWLHEKKTKIIQNIYIFTIKSPEKILERGQGLKITKTGRHSDDDGVVWQ